MTQQPVLFQGVFKQTYSLNSTIIGILGRAQSPIGVFQYFSLT
jgi:hypothetical protein